MRTITSKLGFTFLAAVGLFAAGVAATAALAAPPPTAITTALPSPADTATAPSAPADSAVAAPSGSASASPAPLLPTVRGADIPTETSDKPKESEWKEGRKVRPNRGGDGCELIVVREWLRVLCKDTGGLGLVAGDPKGVTLWTGGTVFSVGGATALVQFPLTRGASRIVGLTRIASDWDWVGLGDGGMMSVTWRDGEPDPIVGIYRTGEHDK